MASIQSKSLHHVKYFAIQVSYDHRSYDEFYFAIIAYLLLFFCMIYLTPSDWHEGLQTSDCCMLTPWNRMLLFFCICICIY